uniref:phosphopyruvate hydratase n=1 Tax=Branchiostoma floridae TaxID=7739 RepID=C3Y3R9_BRAFL|eukprot:XP_002608935.1 hypothetical protein BRAFLDRAFT_85491 [Branchiostoma floridae]
MSSRCTQKPGMVTARNTTDLGAYAPQYDKLEQPLDLVQEALAALELQAGEDVHMAINCAAHEMFELYIPMCYVMVTARNTTDLGAYAPQYDKLEQPLDLVQEALAALELQAGEDVHMAINCAAHEMFELDTRFLMVGREKGKYEVMTGTQKTPDDMVDFYSDILTRYPGVIGLIDPLRKQDKTAWVKLTQAVSEKCYLMGDQVYPRTEKFLVQGMEETKSSAAVFSLHSLTTVTDVIDAAKLVEDVGSEVVLAACQGDTADTTLTDLAVGLWVKFAKFGGLGRGERVAKYNRLAQIEARLADQDKLAPHEEHKFPDILPPPPPEEPEGEAAD